MKICGVVCEYNPFHFGHEYQLRKAKELSGADALICIMSGYFSQRGDAAILPPQTRAKHAILCGADAVVSLPTIFSVATAEIFARGAIRLLNSLPDFCVLSFGAEHSAADFYSAAEILQHENLYMDQTKKLLKKGVGFALARSEALKTTPIADLLYSPNDILALEYARALINDGKREQVTLMPIARKGDYKNSTLESQNRKQENYSSAAAIRAAIENGKTALLSAEVPPCVYEDLQNAVIATDRLKTAEKIAVLTASVQELADTADVTEGLENALKKAAQTEGDVAKILTSKRYTLSRINRILLQNLLQIRKDSVKQCLSEPLYIRPLAVKKERTDVLAALSRGIFPLITRHTDEKQLCGAAKRCFETDRLAEKIYSAVTGFYSGTKELFY